MAQRAVPGLYAGIAARDYDHTTARDDTVIACPSARKMTVLQAQEMFERCLGVTQPSPAGAAKPRRMTNARRPTAPSRRKRPCPT